MISTPTLSVPSLRTVSNAVLILCVVFLRVCTACAIQAAASPVGVSSQPEMRSLGSTPDNPYIGSAACARCHAALTTSQVATSMAQAAIDPAHAGLGERYASMAYREGKYTSTIVSTQHGLRFQVSDGQSIASAPIRWIFGNGITGQTFILEQDGRFFESRASYYTTLHSLDLTVGHARTPPTSLAAALGRPLPQAEVEKCFACHLSENVHAGQIDSGAGHPGVSCENCHGAGTKHAAPMNSPLHQSATIFNPGDLAPSDQNDFCGSCHRTAQDVLISGIRDIRNVRFQPYRLENSKCYNPADPRITCVACHDPHRELDPAPAHYDQKCLACHSSTKNTSPQQAAMHCPRATTNCVTCHMPKLNVPGAHYAFTDHYIRVNEPNQPYPD